jgi:hypothetical protein
MGIKREEKEKRVLEYFFRLNQDKSGENRYSALVS